MTADPILVEAHGPVLVITLNRPEVRNAVNTALAVQLSAALDRLDADPNLRVGVLAANGKVFCAGMDLKAFAAGEVPTIDPRGFAGITRKPPVKPLVAAVEGPAVGGGFEVVLSCDLVVASSAARFALPEVTRGLTAAAGGLFRLPARLPYALAMEMALTGEPMSAEQAQAAHLVNRVVAPGEALECALDIAALIASRAPLAVAASKRVVVESRDWPLAEQFTRQEAVSGEVRLSADAAEGARAFLEKRAPVWSGR